MFVPLNWRLTVAEQLFILSDARPKVLVLEQAFDALLPALAGQLPDTFVAGLNFSPLGGSKWDCLVDQGRGDDRNQHADLSCPLLIVYTSGTTGRPKGAVLRQEALLWNGIMSQHMHNLGSTDHVLTVLPLFHVGGLNIQTTRALHHGATVTIHTRFTPEATLAAIERDRPTLAALVPTTMQSLADHPQWRTTDLSSLKAICSGSTMVPQHLIERFVARGVPVLQVYGSTETCLLLCIRGLAAILRVRARAACPAYAAKRLFSMIPARSCRQAARARSPYGAPMSSAGIGALNKQRASLCTTAGISPVTSAAAMPMDTFGFMIAKGT